MTATNFGLFCGRIIIDASIGAKAYRFDLTTMQQINAQTDYGRPMRRRVLDSGPVPVAGQSDHTQPGVWEFEEYGAWVCMSDDHQRAIEASYQTASTGAGAGASARGEVVVSRTNGQGHVTKYRVSLTDMTQQNLATKYVRTVRRRLETGQGGATVVWHYDNGQSSSGPWWQPYDGPFSDQIETQHTQDAAAVFTLTIAGREYKVMQRLYLEVLVVQARRQGAARNKMLASVPHALWSMCLRPARSVEYVLARSVERVGACVSVGCCGGRVGKGAWALPPRTPAYAC